MPEGKIVHQCEVELFEFGQQLHLVIVCEFSVEGRVVLGFLNNCQAEEVSNLVYSSFLSTNNMVCSTQYREDSPELVFEVGQSSEEVLLLLTDYYSFGTFVLSADREDESIRL